MATECIRISLVPAVDLQERIETECDLRLAREPPRRLAAAFEAQKQLVLIFQD